MNPQNVVFGQNMVLHQAPYEADIELPADTVDWGEAWGAPFEEIGYTQGGVTLTMNVTRGSIRADQEIDDLFRPVTARDIRVAGSLLEYTMDNLLFAFGQAAVSTVAAGVGTRGHTDFALSSTPTTDYYSIGMDVLHPGDDEAVRLLMPKGLSVGNVSSQFGIGDQAALISFEFAALPSAEGTLILRDIIPATAA